MKPSIASLNDAEREWIQKLLELARKLADNASTVSAVNPSLASLDRAFKNQLNATGLDGETINHVINAIGAAFGEELCQKLGMRWVVATDEHGCELAAYLDRGEIIVFPMNFVAKRWERQETDFLEASYRAIARDVSVVQESWANRT